MSLIPRKAEAIVAKMIENQNWTFNTQTCHESEEVPQKLCTINQDGCIIELARTKG